MTVDNAPRIKKILLEVWKPLTALFAWDVAVTILYFTHNFHVDSLPLTIFGTVVALFLTARTGSAYARWWEGRMLWGQMINSSRNLARAVIAFLPEDGERMRDMKRTLVLRQIAYVHALRGQLRRHSFDDDVHRFLSAGEASPSLARTNAANGILDGSARRLAETTRSGAIDTIQQTHIERVLVDIANAQGGMERLKNTPLPMQYRFFPDFFTRVFCILLPIGVVETLGWATPVGSTVAGLMFLAALQVGDDLADPFNATPHDLPLKAMCRTIEIDLLQAIGDPAPEPLTPVKGVLW
jgi:putative membrane protein